jgi:hypothetical protein
MAGLRIPALLLAAVSLGATTADRPATFSYDPAPRWQEEPATGELCKAIENDCPGLVKDGQIEAEWGYAELYNADGFLVGLRSVKSTGCKPLDEDMLLSHRDFVTVFSKDGGPDLDGIKVEVAAGTNPDSVRLVKSSATQVSIGCS